MRLEWIEELSVGNAVIDAEHRSLISMIGDVEQEICARNIPVLMGAFGLLENQLCVHFSNEEKIAQALGIPFDQHRRVQQYLLRELRYMRDELAAKNGLWSDSAIKHFSQSLGNWMIDEHILGLDMQMKPLLQTHPYDFKPD